MRRTAFKLPRSLRDRYIAQVNNSEGYGPRGKSRWVREAIERLFTDDPGLQQVGHAREHEIRDAFDNVIFDTRTEAMVQTGIHLLRSQYPLWEGVQGDIVRAAIVHRLKKEGVADGRRNRVPKAQKMS